MNRFLPAALFAAALATPVLDAPALAQTAPGSTAPGSALTDRDRQFLAKDASGSIYESYLAALAQKKTSRDDIRSYAAMLLSDHAEYNAALQQLARAKGVILPTDMTADDRTRLNSMNLQGGSTFNRSFILEAIRINDEDKQDAQKEAAATSDPDIKAFLQKFAAMDARHEQDAKMLRQ